jgi:hypothetical protein
MPSLACRGGLEKTVGLTCATVHVFAGEASALRERPESDRLLEEACAHLGYERVAEPADGERQVIVLPGPPWLSILDQLTADTVTEELGALAAQLSAVSRRPVLLTAVHDSDAFCVLLYENGKQVDGHASEPGLLPFKVKKWAANKRAREWSRAFHRPVTDEDLNSFARGGDVFADDALARLCHLLGLPLAQAALTFRDVAGGAGASGWHYHFRERAEAHRGDPSARHIGGRHFGKATQPLPLGRGATDGLLFELTAQAGALSTPTLEFSGPALEQGLVEVTRAAVLWHCGVAHVLERARAKVRGITGPKPKFAAQVTAAASDGRRVVRASAPNMSPAVLEQKPRTKVTLLWDADLRATAAGSGELHISFLPRPESGERIPLQPVYLIKVSG